VKVEHNEKFANVATGDGLGAKALAVNSARETWRSTDIVGVKVAMANARSWWWLWWRELRVAEKYAPTVKENQVNPTIGLPCSLHRTENERPWQPIS
jgi:hypothetical protein